MLKSYNKFLALLNKKEKTNIILLTILLIFGMLMEVLGIGLLFPLLEIISNKNIIIKYPFLKNIFEYFFITSFKQQVYFFLIVIFFIYLIKGIYLVFLSYKQYTFLQNLNARISSDLFKIYLKQPYINYTKLKTSKLIKHITTDISFFYSYSNGILSFFSEIALLIAILITIIFIEPTGAILIGCLFVFFSSIFYFFSRKKIIFWGIEKNNLLEKIAKVTLEGFNGFKELLIFQKRNFFINNYLNIRFNISSVLAKMSTLSIVPRHYLEFITILVFISFILFGLFENKDIEILIPTVGLFIAGSFKIIPSINKLIIASQNIKFYSNSIDILLNEFKLKSNIIEKDSLSTIEKINFNDFIKFQTLSFKYNFENKLILEKINLKVNKGNTIGIVGKSGVGKSTLVDIMVGILKPSSGTIAIDNKKFDFIPDTFKNQISYISQNVFLFDSSIADNIKMSDSKLNEIEKNKIIEALKSSDLFEMVNELPEGINTMVGENGINLSGGQKQRIAIARALYRKSRILILDEATSNLDNHTENKIIESINLLKGKLTIIIISHRLSILNNCDSIYELKNKQLQKLKL